YGPRGAKVRPVGTAEASLLRRFPVAFVNMSAFHHKIDLLQQFYIRNRVSLDRDDVGIASGLDAPYRVGAPDQVGGVPGRRENRFDGRHSSFNHVLKLFGVLPVRIDSGIGPESDLDAASICPRKRILDKRPDLSGLHLYLWRIEPGHVRVRGHCLSSDYCWH